MRVLDFDTQGTMDRRREVNHQERERYEGQNDFELWSVETYDVCYDSTTYEYSGYTWESEATCDSRESRRIVDTWSDWLTETPTSS